MQVHCTKMRTFLTKRRGQPVHPASLLPGQRILQIASGSLPSGHPLDDFLEQFHGRQAPRLLTEHSGRLEDVELSTISDSLRDCGGNVSAAARKLGISRNTLYRKMKVT
jgi:DNA-binding NtrC family response regulator